MPSSLIDPDLLARFGDAAAGVHVATDPGLDPGVRTALRESLRESRSLGPLREGALTAAPDRRRVRRSDLTHSAIIALGAEVAGLGLTDPKVRRLLASAGEMDRG
jgi:hypothetical protein